MSANEEANAALDALRASKKSAHPIRWDEQNLEDNAAEAESAQRMKILEPKTPFHTLGDDGETPNAFPPKAPPARAAGPSDVLGMSAGLQPGMDFSALTEKALERRDEMEDDEVEKKRKFEENRKKHYNTGTKGGLAALRAQAAALDDEEEED